MRGGIYPDGFGVHGRIRRVIPLVVKRLYIGLENSAVRLHPRNVKVPQPTARKGVNKCPRGQPERAMPFCWPAPQPQPSAQAPTVPLLPVGAVEDFWGTLRKFKCEFRAVQA